MVEPPIREIFVKLNHLPNFRDGKHKKSLSCHHAIIFLDRHQPADLIWYAVRSNLGLELIFSLSLHGIHCASFGFYRGLAKCAEKRYGFFQFFIVGCGLKLEERLLCMYRMSVCVFDWFDMFEIFDGACLLGCFFVLSEFLPGMKKAAAIRFRNPDAEIAVIYPDKSPNFWKKGSRFVSNVFLLLGPIGFMAWGNACIKITTAKWTAKNNIYIYTYINI